MQRFLFHLQEVKRTADVRTKNVLAVIDFIW